MQKTVAIPQFLGESAIVMPGAVQAVEFFRHFSDLRADMPITVVNPRYARHRHVVISTGLRLCLFNIRRNYLSRFSQKPHEE
jgi:hypothetical protein